MYKALKFVLLLILMIGKFPTLAQELYPLSEPASNIPKHTLGVKVLTETFKEVNQIRNISMLRLAYGVTPKLSVYATALFSNHHGDKLPEEFPYHNTPERGAIYPYKFNGVHLYAKYRFLTIDKQNEHFRMAVYAEGAKVNTTHHEGEPNLLMGDNSGFGGGLIATYLKNKFAASITLGGIFPTPYVGVSPDPIPGLPDIPEKVVYGNALEYRLSLGYLVFPRKYKNFDQTNFNVYCEFIGRYFGDTKVTVNYGTNNPYELKNNMYPAALKKQAFLEVSPGFQFIIKSNLRLDFATTFPLVHFSYAKLYPVYTIGAQYYFYL